MCISGRVFRNNSTTISEAEMIIEMRTKIMFTTARDTIYLVHKQIKLF